MPKVTVKGDAVIVQSTHTVTDLEEAKEYFPHLLMLKDEENKKNVIFAMEMGQKASLTDFGVVFTSENNDGFATATLQLPTGLSQRQKEKHIKNYFTTALLRLKTLEQQLHNNLDQMNQDLTSVNQMVIFED